ncbi:MAG: hypothetical protein ABI742_05870 [Gemmatimonadota bacterium]
MKPSGRGIWLMLIHLLLALAIFAKLGFDRATLPRVWARTVAVDPDDPFRGRYIRLWLDATDVRAAGDSIGPVEFFVSDGQLKVRKAAGWSGFPIRQPAPPQARGVVVDEPLAYFVPEKVRDPSRLDAGQELWAEVSVPHHGLPRPIRLEVRQR